MGECFKLSPVRSRGKEYLKILWLKTFIFLYLGELIFTLFRVWGFEFGISNRYTSFKITLDTTTWHYHSGSGCDATASQFQNHIPQLKISATHPLGLEVYVRNCDIVTWDTIFSTNLPMKLGRNNVVMFLRETEKRKTPYLNLSCNNSRY